MIGKQEVGLGGKRLKDKRPGGGGQMSGGQKT